MATEDERTSSISLHELMSLDAERMRAERSDLLKAADVVLRAKDVAEAEERARADERARELMQARTWAAAKAREEFARFEAIRASAPPDTPAASALRRRGETHNATERWLRLALGAVVVLLVTSFALFVVNLLPR